MSEDRKELALATLITTVLLLAGVGILWVGKRFLDIDGDAVFVALLIVPVLAYSIITGKIAE